MSSVYKLDYERITAYLKPISLTPELRRKEEKLVARACLARCLNDLGENTSAVDLLAEDILTDYKKKYLLSISHSEQYAVAAVSKLENFMYLGIDIEQIDRPTKNGFLDRISNQKEISELRKLNYNKQQLAIVAFSIKEAAYKATSDICPEFSYQNYKIIISENKINVKVVCKGNKHLNLNCWLKDYQNQIISVVTK